MTTIVVGILVLVLIALIGFGLSIRIVKEYQGIRLCRLGPGIGWRGPGLVLINPVTDRTSWIDLREQFLEIPRDAVITSDNASSWVAFLIFYRGAEPTMSVLQVASRPNAAINVAAPTLRTVVGDMMLDD